jgi:enoyl-CoA hydratase/carnithine racemase
MGTVRVDVADGVATITLDWPENRNALSRALVTGLHGGLDRADEDDVRAVVLTHTRPAFCAGADLKERSSGPPDSGPLVGVMQRIEQLPKPVIARVEGAVRAGGVGLMATCDLIVVARNVDFAFTEVRLGLAPAIISVPVSRRVNPARLAPAFLTGERFDAATALEMGLVTHVSDDPATTVDHLLAGILAGAPAAVAETKWILRHVAGMEPDEAYGKMRDLSDSLFESEDGREGMQAFLEKRPPRWQARPGS